MSRRPYHIALAGCTLEIPSDGLVALFHTIRATFPFYQTGEPVMTDVTFVLDNGRPLVMGEVVQLLKHRPGGA